MDPTKTPCPNPDCSLYEKTGRGNVRLHSKKENRLRCRNCGKTFSARKGTLFYRRHYDEETITCVVTLLAYGCPAQAACQAFGLDERTVADWHRAAGLHCQRLHQHIIESTQMDLKQVQADELRIKAQGQILWMALALCVTSRLWLAGVVSSKRDKTMARLLALKVRACALCRPLLIVFDGFVAYVDAFRKAFRSPERTGKRGRPRLVPWPGVILGQIIKQRTGHRLDQVKRRLVPSSWSAILSGPASPEAIPRQAQALLTESQGGGTLNTAYIERLNATFRSVIAPLARRTRALARTPALLEASMYLAGSVYNFCTEHRSLSVALLVVGKRGEQRRWVGRTPAMAASLTDHCWSVRELLTYRFTQHSLNHG